MSDEPETCPRCSQPKHRGRCKKAAPKTLATVVKKHTKRKAVPKASTPGSLTKEASFGFRCTRRDGLFDVAQEIEVDGERTTVEVTLSRADIDELHLYAHSS